MAVKLWRGKTIKSTPDWRGTCPVCQRTGVKLLWKSVKDDETLKVCKHCRSKESE
jgi:hypothetical protein